MTRSIGVHSREEALRVWAGGLLNGTRDYQSSPAADPERTRDFLRLHGIGPLLAAAPDNGGFASRRDSKELIKRNVAAEMVRKQEFVSVLRTIQTEAGLAPIIFKGQALAYDIYPRPWLRPRTDIDALVERSNFEAMGDTLVKLGYERAGAIDADLVLPQLSLLKQKHGVRHVWDVHWRISNRPALANVLGYPGLREAAVETSIDDVRFLTPDRMHSLLIACLHLIGHHPGELRLIWLYDIHLLAASLSAGERRRFMGRAMERPQVRAACHAALEATQRYIPGEPTDELRRALDPGPGARWRGERSYLAGLVEDAAAVAKGKRLRFVTQHVLPSSDYMMKRFGIRHRWQLPFWYVVRIGRAVPKLFRRR